MAAFAMVLVVSLALGGRLLLLRRQGDYRNATFYKVLYTPVGFQLAILGRRLFGRWISERFCEVAGLAYALTHASTLAAIQRNMALLDPSKATRNQAIRNCITQGYNFLEFAELWLKKKGEIRGMIGAQFGWEEFAKAHALGKGCILVTGHLGFFELGGPLLAELGFPMVTLTLPEPSESLTQWRSEFRLRWGVRTLVVGDDAFSAVEIARELRSGAFVALLADRPFNKHSVPVPLPYGEILFSTAPVMVSLLSGAPIIPVGLTLQPDGKHRVEARPMLTPKWLPEGREASLLHFTQKLAQELTPMFVRAPEQWHHFSDLALHRQ